MQFAASSVSLAEYAEGAEEKAVSYELPAASAGSQ
jgi:hypothetical protein